MDFERKCPHGHGLLKKIDRISGVPVSFGLPAFHDPKNDPEPFFITDLLWYLCPVCGYSEIVDEDPAQTLRMMGDRDDG